MASTISILALSLLVGTSALQIPLNFDQKYLSSKSLINSESLQAGINVGNLYNRAEALYAAAQLSEDKFGHPTRVIGSPGHIATLDYIYSNLKALGDYYTISNQSFDAVNGQVFESRLVLGSEVPASASVMSLSPPTKHKEPVYGPLVLVANNGCAASDYPASIANAIALIRRGSCSFGAKSEQAGKAGAIAAVVYNNEQGSLSGTLGTPSPNHVPTFGLSPSDAAPFIALLEEGKDVPSSAYVDSIVETVTTFNIIAQTVEGDPDNCVMIGGHSDSVSEGPGINDDGTGTLTLLEVATQLTKFRVKNCVRFGWWAGEEEGLLGSDFYVESLSEEENLKIRVFMDYDMLASPNFAYQVYDGRNAVNPAGSQEIRDLYTEFYTAHGQNWTYIPFDGRSDYDAFIKNGIPGGGIATGAEAVKTKAEQDAFGGIAGQWLDPCYHQLCDDLSNLNMTAWELNAKLVAHSVATYAESFDGFPKRAGVESLMTADVFHGPALVM